MCDDCALERSDPTIETTTRRTFLTTTAGAFAGLALSARLPNWGPAQRVRADLVIHPRSDWGADLVPGPLETEPDVRFLLVHHTAGRNEYTREQVRDQLREVFTYHTGPEKGWSDVCYNFFVDRYGGVWEGRAGSLAGPVMADATGGSQGFAQLVCLPGNFMEVDPTPEMVESLAQLLAYLADRYGISSEPEATVNFVSRGSNRWPAGAEVSARTISGHRDMSATACPGDRVYALLADVVPARVRQLRGIGASIATGPSAVPSAAAPIAPVTTVPPSTTVSPTTASSTTAPSTTVAEPAASTSTSATTSASTTSTTSPGAVPPTTATAPTTAAPTTAPDADGSSSTRVTTFAVGAAVTAIGVSGSIVAAKAARRRPQLAGPAQPAPSDQPGQPDQSED